VWTLAEHRDARQEDWVHAHVWWRDMSLILVLIGDRILNIGCHGVPFRVDATVWSGAMLTYFGIYCNFDGGPQSGASFAFSKPREREEFEFGIDSPGNW
jgi:hypothetical protein